MENLRLLIDKLCLMDSETTCVEFKDSNAKPEMIGEDISALANSAKLEDKQCAYMLWGIDDKTHEILGTSFNRYTKAVGQQEIESWLRNLLSKNVEFEFQDIVYDDKKVVVLIIQQATQLPVTFKKEPYIRVGSYTKRIAEYPNIQAKLWEKLRATNFETQVAKGNLDANSVLNLLEYPQYFKLMNRPIPQSAEEIIHYLKQDEIIQQQDDGRYSVSNFGALLFAKKFSDFPPIARKEIRVVQYEDNTRLSILKNESFEYGYATSYLDVLSFIKALIPSKEKISEDGQRTPQKTFPFIAIRELVANSLIHQDLNAHGVRPVIEIFSDRIEITNPGLPIIDVARIIDNPPKSRNEALAKLMRRMGLCEELGSGWDRAVMECEKSCIPSPKIDVYEEATKVSIFKYIPYSQLSLESRLWCCYLHACLLYVEQNSMTNKSLRDRFGLPATGMSQVSRLIKEAQLQKLIKPLDSTTAPRHMKYIPFWG